MEVRNQLLSLTQFERERSFKITESNEGTQIT